MPTDTEKKVSFDVHVGKEYVNKNKIIISFQCPITRLYDPKPQL